MGVLNAAELQAGGGLLFRDPRRQLYPLSARNGALYAVTNGSTRYAQSIRRVLRNGKLPLTNIRVRLSNWYISTSTGLPVNTGNRIKVNISIASTTSSTPIPLYVNGSRDIFIENGQTVDAVDISGYVAPANTNLWLFIYATAVDAAGAQLTSGRLPTGRATTLLGGGAAETVAYDGAATDKTTTVGGETTAVAEPANLFHPFAVLGEPLYPQAAALTPAIIGFGDSIMVGRVEVDNFGADSLGNSGWAERWIGNSGAAYGFINLGVSSTKASQWAAIGSGSYDKLIQALHGIGTHALWSHGVNDVGNYDAATLLANETTAASFLKNSLGLRSVLNTLTPIQSSSDLWATLGNQSDVVSNTSRRNAFNALVKAGSYDTSVWSGSIDGGSLVESGSTGKWLVTGSANGYCGDSSGAGVHPTALGHSTIAAGLPDPSTVFTFA